MITVPYFTKFIGLQSVMNMPH